MINYVNYLRYIVILDLNKHCMILDVRV